MNGYILILHIYNNSAHTKILSCTYNFETNFKSITYLFKDHLSEICRKYQKKFLSKNRGCVIYKVHIYLILFFFACVIKSELALLRKKMSNLWSR